MTEMIPLFPTMVLKKAMLNFDKEKTIGLLDPYWSMYDAENATGAALSETGSLSTSTIGILDIHKKPEFKFLIDFVMDAVNEYWADQEYKYSPEIQYMWANKYTHGGNAMLHNHSPHVLSGVFYVNMESDEHGMIYFQDPNEALLCMQPQQDDKKVGMNTQCMSVRSGDLIIFPSWLKHGTRKNQTDDTKITIAFDIVLRGTGVLRKMLNHNKETNEKRLTNL